MRLEHGHTQRNAALLRHGPRTRDHGLVPSMHAIEIAERNRCAARIMRNC
jgi:hypothetical protein